MKRILAALLLIPLMGMSQSGELKAQYENPDYIKKQAIELLQMIRFQLKFKDYDLPKSATIFPEGTDEEAALRSLIENDDLTENGVLALEEVGTLTPLNEYRNADAHNLARDLNLDTGKCWAIVVAGEISDCWFYFDGPADRFEFFLIRNI
jgi:hypothetical protein